MFIPRSVISGVFFPGVVVHELAHVVGCKITGTKVHEVRYFDIADSSGSVRQNIAKSIWRQMVVSYAPLVLNTALAFGFGVASAYLYKASGSFSAASIIVTYLSFAMGYHAFPSLADSLPVDAFYKCGNISIVEKIVIGPFLFVFALKAVLDFVVLDLLYAGLIGIILPYKILGVY